MTPETTDSSQPEPQGLSQASRITGVFFEPAATFQDIARRPTILISMLLVVLSGVVFTALQGQRIGWDRIQQQQQEMMGQRAQERMAQIPPEQRARQEEIQRKIAPVMGYVGSIVGMPLIWLINAAILLLIVKVFMGVPVTLKQVYSILTYAALPIVLQNILKIVVLYLKKPDDFNVTNPLALNPAAFMDPATTSKFLYVWAMALDLFVLWALFLTATGLKAAGGKRLSFGGALMAVVIPYALFVSFGAGMAAAFS